MHRATTDRRGFFQVQGLAPGAYIVVANAAGYSPARASVLVRADQATMIADPPLLLRPAQTLTVYVNPPSPPPAVGVLWQVELVQLDMGGEVLERREPVPCSLGGSCRMEGLSTGSYRLRVEGPGGRSWFSETLDIDPSLVVRHVDIPIVPVRGTVTLGGDPLAASVYFGTSNGGVELASNVDGHFEGVLPRSGSWRVEVRAESAKLRRNLAAIEVVRDPVKGYATIDLDLPSTFVKGSVVDEDGKPFSGAIVSIRGFDTQWDRYTQERSGRDGEFAFAGLPPGRFAVRATGVRAETRVASSRVEVELEEHVDHEAVRLVVRKDTVLRGRVVAFGVGVPGARVKAHGTSAMDRSVSRVTTDADGRFEVSLPGDAGDVLVGIGARGFAYEITRRRFDSKTTQIFEIAQAGGTLTVDRGEAGSGLVGPILVLLHEGGLESVDYLQQTWARLHDSEIGARVQGGPYVLPELSAGSYWVCATDTRHLDTIAATGTPHGACAGGYLPDGGALSLTLAPPE